MAEDSDPTVECAEDYRAAFELAAVGKAQVDPKTNRFTRVNAKLCEMTGFSVEELLDKQFLDITHPDDRDESTAESFKKLLSGELADYSIEKRYLRKDGSVFWVLVNARATRNPDGTPKKLFGVIQDISARKHAEQALMETRDQLAKYAQELEQRVAERTARLEDAIKALDSFCYGVAHDLRAPVRSVHGYSSMLKQEKFGFLDEEGKKFVERILTAAQHMDELIDGLLMYGRFSQSDLPSAPVDLNQTLNRVLHNLDQAVKEANGQVDVKGPLPNVWGNATVLEQVFANLLGNALKYVRDGVPPAISVYSEEHDTTVRIFVKDNGLGIAPEHQERIFRIFERLQNANSIPGTGVGLALVKKGVERLGGKVGLESNVGQGSCFWVDLMKAKSQANPSPQAAT